MRSSFLHSTVVALSIAPMAVGAECDGTVPADLLIVELQGDTFAFADSVIVIKADRIVPNRREF